MTCTVRAGSALRRAILLAIALTALLCLASQAGGVDRPAARRPRSAGPTILAIKVSRASLPSSGGTVRVTMHTADAAGCRLASFGRNAVAASAPRSWSNCSRGIARATVEIGANPFGATVSAHFRDFARRGLQVTWEPVTILVRPAPSGQPAPAGVNDYTESTNWSGYVVPSSQSVIDSTSGTWTVPTLDCADTPNSEVSEWVGVGGVDWPGGGSSGALLQTGTEDRCVDGAQQDDAWWELYPSDPNQSFTFANLAVSPGDDVVASVRRTTGGHWATKIDDVTKGVAGIMVTGAEYGTSVDGGSGSFSKQGSTALLTYSGAYSAEWIVEDSASTPTELSPFANFGTIVFSDLSTSVATWSLTPSEGVEIVQNGVVLSTPGEPNSNGFDVRYTGP